MTSRGRGTGGAGRRAVGPGWLQPTLRAVIGAAVILLVAACSSSGSAHAAQGPPPAAAPTTTPPEVAVPSTPVPPAKTGPRPCLPSVGAALGRELGQRVRRTEQLRVPEVLTCAYTAVVTSTRACTSVKVIVDTDPQPTTDFERWEVETGQEVTQGGGTNNPAAYPQIVPGIGIGADWVPTSHELDAVNSRRWVRVFLTCPQDVGGLRQAEPIVRAGLIAPLG
jgi:hypothetical protein